jgi:hypothetical protein
MLVDQFLELVSGTTAQLNIDKLWMTPRQGNQHLKALNASDDPKPTDPPRRPCFDESKLRSI